MTLTVDFDSNPRTIYAAAGSTVYVKFVDKSVTTNGVVNSWAWMAYPSRTLSFPGSPDIGMTDANLYFAVDDMITFTSLSYPSGLPTGLNERVTYWIIQVTATTFRISTSKGGSAVTYSGSPTSTCYGYHYSDQQNPILPYRNVATASYMVTLGCNDSGGTGVTYNNKSNWIKIVTGTFTPPAQTTAFRNLSLFVYERSSETSPKSTVICRNKTSTCNLLYMNLQVQGAITKAGKATFDIVNTGSATANEIDLFESGTIGRYKNIAIVAGYDVIWSGKITKAEKELMSQPGSSPQKAIYHCEAYSDVKKLSDWNIKTPTSLIGKTPGQALTSILDVNSGEPDFIGTRGGFIDQSGIPLQMTLSDTDKLSAFSSLTAATDYDWRTRMETMLFQYASFNGTDTVTITSAGLTASALIGQWLLFPTENMKTSITDSCGILNTGGAYIDLNTIVPAVGDMLTFSSTGSLPAEIVTSTIYYVVSVDPGNGWRFQISATKGGAAITYSAGATGTVTWVKHATNLVGVQAWGRITANTTTTITATLVGTSVIPLLTDNCLVVNIPRMDFSSDLMELTVVRAFTNNLNCAQFKNADDKVDLFTKVVVKGKTHIPEWDGSTLLFSIVPSQISVSLTAKDAWDSTDNFFSNSTVITQKTEGFVHSYAASSDTIILFGQNYALKNGDVIYVFGPTTGGQNTATTQTISGTPTTQTQPDGTATTTITVVAGNELTTPLIKYGLVVGAKTYFKNTSKIPVGIYINVGSSTRYYNAGGTDVTYGQYLSLVGISNPKRIHYPGCIASSPTYSEASPQTGSSAKVHGVVTRQTVSDVDTTYPDLEVIASNTLLQGSQYYQKSTMVVSYYQFTINRVRDGVQLTKPALIREGQRISIVPNTGATAIERQVVVWELDTNTMRVTLTLGDYQKDVFNIIDKTTAATQKGLL